MLGAEGLLADGDGALVERLGLGPGGAGLVVERRLVQRPWRPSSRPAPSRSAASAAASTCGSRAAIRGPGCAPRAAAAGPPHQPDRRLGPGLGGCLVEPVAGHGLDQAVDAERRRRRPGAARSGRAHRRPRRAPRARASPRAAPRVGAEQSRGTASGARKASSSSSGRAAGQRRSAASIEACQTVATLQRVVGAFRRPRGQHAGRLAARRWR